VQDVCVQDVRALCLPVSVSQKHSRERERQREVRKARKARRGTGTQRSRERDEQGKDLAGTFPMAWLAILVTLAVSVADNIPKRNEFCIHLSSNLRVDTHLLTKLIACRSPLD